jgi:hypothetical protein
MHSKENNKKLFGTGIVLYGFSNLILKHPKDLGGFLVRICKDYVFEEFKTAEKIIYIDADFEGSFDSQPGWLGSYLSFILYTIGSLGFLKWNFGNPVSKEICLFMDDIKGMYSDAGFIYENAPTKLKFRQSPGIGLKVLHFIDRPRNCFPSLHVILTAYTYLKTKELIAKYASDHTVHASADHYLFKWAIRIIESCLMTKQHSFRDIAGALALVSSKFPQFERKDTEGIIEQLFLDNPRGLSGDTKDLIRNGLKTTYSELMTTINLANSSPRSVLVDYVRSI